jgi:hypothetical protein
MTSSLLLASAVGDESVAGCIAFMSAVLCVIYAHLIKGSLFVSLLLPPSLEMTVIAPCL